VVHGLPPATPALGSLSFQGGCVACCLEARAVQGAAVKTETESDRQTERDTRLSEWAGVFVVGRGWLGMPPFPLVSSSTPPPRPRLVAACLTCALIG
jgi:hypothetical protein